MKDILQQLWLKVVQPIIKALNYLCMLFFELYNHFNVNNTFRFLQHLQVALVYGGVQLALLYFFHSMQLEYMLQKLHQDLVFLIMQFPLIHPLFIPLTASFQLHLLHLSAPQCSLSVSQKHLVYSPFLQLRQRQINLIN